MDFRSHIREKLKGQQFMKHIGFEITKIEEGLVEGEMSLETFTQQQMGFLHGGVTLTVSDIVMGFAAVSVTPLDKHVVTAELKCSFLNPGVGNRIRAVGKVLKRGNRMHFVEGEVFCYDELGKETLIAKSTTTMAVIG